MDTMCLINTVWFIKSYKTKILVNKSYFIKEWKIVYSNLLLYLNRADIRYNVGVNILLLKVANKRWKNQNKILKTCER